MSQTEQEKWQEVALVDISYEVLSHSDKAMSYREIFKEAARMKGLSEEELMELLPQVYTEMNLDGRFICISPGQWGLKKWYTTEAIEESVEALARSKGIDDDDDYGFDDDFNDDDEDFTEDTSYDPLAASDDDDDDDDDEDEDADIDEDLDEEDLDEFEEDVDVEEDAEEDLGFGESGDEDEDEDEIDEDDEDL